MSTKAISPSALGWISEAIGTLEPWSTIMRSVSWPKSGWLTLSMSITAWLVTPIFLPTMRSPCSRRRAIRRCWMA
ncbi:hypothetical protein D3C81_2226050 [compost metagenome]